MYINFIYIYIYIICELELIYSVKFQGVLSSGLVSAFFKSALVNACLCTKKDVNII